MNSQSQAQEPFQFYTRANLTELTGIRARTLDELLRSIQEVPGSCIYHHTHRFLQQHQYLSPEPPNDFAYWVSGILGEDELGEMLASIDTVQYASIRSLREKIAGTIKTYLEHNPSAQARAARPGDEFYFMKSISFILPTPFVAHTLEEFADILKKVTLDSIYFHIFEARLRLEKEVNDFSNWIEHSLGEQKLARKIARLDPYTYTMEDLRKTLIALLEKSTR